MASHASAATPFSAADHENDGKHHVLLGATGSVAAIKLPLITRALSIHAPKVSIRIVVTAAALKFLQAQSAEQPDSRSLTDLPGVEAVYEDQDEWSKPWVRGDKILHIELRRWAHIFVIAPLSANSLAKIVNGMSDGLLTSVVRAWDPDSMVGVGDETKRQKRILVAPAMNTAMWRHPITSKQISVLEEDWGCPAIIDHNLEVPVNQHGWFTVLRPIAKELACGDVGDGAMIEWRELVSYVEKSLGILFE